MRHVRRALVSALAVTVLSGVAVAPASAAVGAAHPGTTVSVSVDAERSDRRPQRLPRIAIAWEAAWNSGDPERLSHLFTPSARYTDHAFGATFTGRDGIAQWAAITGQSIVGATVDVQDAVRRGQRVVIRWTFSGQLAGAPAAFSVPAVTVLRLRGGLIATNDDFYSLAAVLSQSGLPADTTFG